MFTGLVADIGRVEAVDSAGGGARLRITTSLAAELADGDSVSVGGACLTATSIAEGSFGADAMNQTLDLTTLGELGPGDQVNLELALRASDRLGGHIVQGHVDGVGTVTEMTEDGFARRLRVNPPAELLALIVERGSIAVDGVSLTVSGLDRESFEVSLIPETLERTTLGKLAPGTRVNLECDVVARYLQRMISALQPSGSEER
ncbi:MAG: riboflavin synthase [Solirubrobacterales bacterium]